MGSARPRLAGPLQRSDPPQSLALAEIPFQTQEVRRIRMLPYGGDLLNLFAAPGRSAELQAASRDWRSWDMSPRQLCDLEPVLSGGLSPLRGFMSRADYDSVCCTMRLKYGFVWLISIVLDVTQEFAQSIGAGGIVAPWHPEGVMLAALHVDEIWQPHRMAEAEMGYGSVSTSHHCSSHWLYSPQTSSDRSWTGRCDMGPLTQEQVEHRRGRCPCAVGSGFVQALGNALPLFNRHTTLLPGLIAGGARLQEEISSYLDPWLHKLDCQRADNR